MVRNIFTVLLALLLSSNTCNGPDSDVYILKRVTIDKPITMEKDSLFIEFERTSCFGMCPSYTISVSQMGTVIYHGRRDVDSMGYFLGKYPPKELQLLKKQIVRSNFFKLKKHYPDRTIADLPTTHTTIRVDKHFHSVNDQMQAPQELKTLEEQIDSLFLRF